MCGGLQAVPRPGESNELISDILVWCVSACVVLEKALLDGVRLACRDIVNYFENRSFGVTFKDGSLD